LKASDLLGVDFYVDTGGFFLRYEVKVSPHIHMYCSMWFMFSNISFYIFLTHFIKMSESEFFFKEETRKRLFEETVSEK
jgi:hypothetical protein